MQDANEKRIMTMTLSVTAALNGTDDQNYAQYLVVYEYSS